MIDFSSDLGKLVATGLFSIGVAAIPLFGSLVGTFVSALATTRTNRKGERAKWRQDVLTATEDL